MKNDIAIDYGGHWRSGTLEYAENMICRYLRFALYDGEGWRKVPLIGQCYDCGQGVDMECDGKKTRVLNPCPYPAGRGELVFELNIPSGKMAVANDLRREFPILGDYYINHLEGIFKTTEAYAKAGMAHCFVGNTSPGVFRISDKSFVVGTQSSRGRSPVKRSREVAGICTDLWWYSICDYDELLRRGSKKTVSAVKCKPGVYRFRHVHHMTDDRDYEAAAIYSYIDWVREPDEIKDYSAEYKALNLTAGQIIADSIAKWPTLYEGADAIRAAADSLMCTIGNGAEYHPNGFWAYHPDMTNDMPSVDIPTFEGKFRWYPMCSYSTIAEIAGVCEKGYEIAEKPEVVNESFVALAFNICRCILLYGVESSQGEEVAARTVEFARKCMEGLREKYPVPENCANL